MKLLTATAGFLISATALAGADFQVSADGLNVRSGPSISTSIREVISENKDIRFIERDGDWVYIRYYSTNPSVATQGGFSYGWVHADYVKPTSRKAEMLSDSQNCTLHPEVNGKTCMAVSNVAFNCDLTNDGLGFKSCYSNIDLTLSTNIQGSYNINALIDCKMTATVYDKDGFPRRKTESSSRTATIHQGRPESVKMQVKLTNRFRDIADARLENTTCELRNARISESFYNMHNDQYNSNEERRSSDRIYYYKQQQGQY